MCWKTLTLRGWYYSSGWIQLRLRSFIVHLSSELFVLSLSICESWDWDQSQTVFWFLCVDWCFRFQYRSFRTSQCWLFICWAQNRPKTPSSCAGRSFLFLTTGMRFTSSNRFCCFQKMLGKYFQTANYWPASLWLEEKTNAFSAACSCVALWIVFWVCRLL